MRAHPEREGLIIAAAGNLVKIKDGCATVKGYKPPMPLDSFEFGKAGARHETPSQDINAAVLVGMAVLPPSTSPSKRRMRPVRRAVFGGTC
jgi:hypothetical protein